jgi:hypothetical protein
MISVYHKIGGAWVKINAVYHKVSGSWVKIASIYHKVAGAWNNYIPPTTSPYAQYTPTLSSTYSTQDNVLPTTNYLIFTNYYWYNSPTSINLVLYYSPDGTNWTETPSSLIAGKLGYSLSNPSAGSFLTTSELNDAPFRQDHYPGSSTGINYGLSAWYFKAKITATNTYGTTSITTNALTISYPVLPTVSTGSFSGTWAAGSSVTYTAGTATNSAAVGIYNPWYYHEVTDQNGNLVQHVTRDPSFTMNLTSAHEGQTWHIRSWVPSGSGYAASSYVYGSYITGEPSAPTFSGGSWVSTSPTVDTIATYNVGTVNYATLYTNYIYHASGSYMVMTNANTSPIQYYPTTSDVGSQLMAYTIASNSTGTSVSSGSYTSAVTGSSLSPSAPPYVTLLYKGIDLVTNKLAYQVIWGASATGAPNAISYYIYYYGGSDGYTAIRYTDGPYTLQYISNIFYVDTTYGLYWEVAVRASSTWGSATSAQSYSV